MVWYEYKYIPLNDIMDNIRVLSDFRWFEFNILMILIFFIFILIYYIIPIFQIIIQYNDDKKKTIKRKQLVKQIIMQKEIEDEIEQEIKKYKFNVVE